MTIISFVSAVVPFVGSTCLGIVIGWLVRFFLLRFKKFTPQVLGSTISIFLGGSVVAFFDSDKTVRWFYPIGLLIGFILYSAVGLAAGAPPKGGVYRMHRRNPTQKSREDSEHKD